MNPAAHRFDAATPAPAPPAATAAPPARLAEEAPPAAAGAGPRRLSVIIANYNYARYLGEAIASALAIDWPQVEVVVVDNASTDHSREVIEGFGSRIRAIFHPENRGNLESCNTGFAASTGDIVYFLDADDTVEPQMMREVAAAWSAPLSKVQFQVRIIDGEGAATGAFFPQYHVVHSAQELRRMACTIGNYAGPNGPGNVYARWYLERVFPLKPEAGPYSDSCMIAAAPFFGDVATLPRPLARYRVHGANSYAMQAMDAGRFARMLEMAFDLFRYSQRIAGSVGITIEPKAIDRSLHTLAVRAACLRLAPQLHPVSGDTRWRVAGLLLNSMRYAQGMRRRHKAMAVAWGLATLAAPRPWAERLVSWRFAPSTRPALLGRALQASGVLRRE